MKTITRADIAEKIYAEIGMSRKECNEILDSVMAEIGDCLASGHDVKLSSFGSFLLRHKTSRVGRNPKTGVEAKISERTVISFKPSQRLRKALNK